VVLQRQKFAQEKRIFGVGNAEDVCVSRPFRDSVARYGLPSTDSALSERGKQETHSCAEPVLGYCHSSAARTSYKPDIFREIKIKLAA